MHAIGLVLVYCFYVLVSAYFQSFVKWIDGSPRKSVQKEETKGIQEKREMAENLINITSRLLQEDEEGGADREEDRMASLLASVVEASATNTTTTSSIGSTAQHTNPPRIPSFQVPTNSVNASPSVLLRSYQIQRASKYNPGSFSARGGANIRSNRLPAVDWTQSKAAFVNDAPLYTWRSSGVQLDYLEPYGETQILTGNNNQNSKSNKFLCFTKTVELTTSAVSPLQVSAYLYLRIPSAYHSLFDKWQLRYYTVDRWGFHSRKGRTNAPRGPHIRLTDLAGVTSIVKIDNSKYEFHLIRSNGSLLEFRAPTEEIQNLMIERIQGHIDTLKRLTVEGQNECYKIARYYYYFYYYNIILLCDIT